MYSSASAVALLTPNLIAGSPNFTATSTPSKAGVELWLSTGCAMINTRLAGEGYTTPVPNTAAAAAVYGTVQMLETYYAAGMAEMVRVSTRIDTRERTRSQIFLEMFNNGLDALVSGDLVQAGLSVSGTAPIHIGGISVARKSTVTGDSDRVEPRISRRMFDFPGTVGTGAAGEDRQDED